MKLWETCSEWSFAFRSLRNPLSLCFKLCPSTAWVQCVNYKMVPTLCAPGTCQCDVWSVCTQLLRHCLVSETQGEENSLQTDLSLSVADSHVLQKTWVLVLRLKVIVHKFSRSVQLRVLHKSKGFQGTAVSLGLFFWQRSSFAFWVVAFCIQEYCSFVKVGGAPPALLCRLTPLRAAALLNASISENGGYFW